MSSRDLEVAVGRFHLDNLRLPKDADELAMLSERAAKNMRRGAISQTALPARKEVNPKAIPERIGEPSLIKHVVYILKENRTYDQVFGALEQGRGCENLCIFGKGEIATRETLYDQYCLL